MESNATSVVEAPKKAWTFNISNSKFVADKVIRQEIEGVEGGFVLRNVLTKEECNTIVEAMLAEGKDDAEPVLWRKWAENPEEEYKKLGLRIIRKSQAFAGTLWDRIKKWVPETIETVSPKGDKKYIWKAEGLSDRVRLVRYDSGQSFPPHMDGPYVLNTDYQSHLSALFYLDTSGSLFSFSSDFRGGELFFLEPQKDSDKLNRVAKVQPETGLVCIFPHKTLHEGNSLSSGHKYVVRDDIMYKLVKTIEQGGEIH